MESTPKNPWSLSFAEAQAEAKSYLDNLTEKLGQRTQDATIIAQLEARCSVLAEALRPFAQEGAKWQESVLHNLPDGERLYCLLPDGEPVEKGIAAFTLGDLRQAFALLEPKQ